MSKESKEFLKSSLSHFETAQLIFEKRYVFFYFLAGHFLYLSLECILRAWSALEKKEYDKNHDLNKMIEKLNINLTDDEQYFIGVVNYLFSLKYQYLPIGDLVIEPLKIFIDILALQMSDDLKKIYENEWGLRLDANNLLSGIGFPEIKNSFKRAFQDFVAVHELSFSFLVKKKIPKRFKQDGFANLIIVDKKNNPISVIIRNQKGEMASVKIDDNDIDVFKSFIDKKEAIGAKTKIIRYFFKKNHFVQQLTPALCLQISEDAWKMANILKNHFFKEQEKALNDDAIDVSNIPYNSILYLLHLSFVSLMKVLYGRYFKRSYDAIFYQPVPRRIKEYMKIPVLSEHREDVKFFVGLHDMRYKFEQSKEYDIEKTFNLFNQLVFLLIEK